MEPTSNKTALCKCYKQGFIAAFEVPEIITFLETVTTPAPSTTTTATTSVTETESETGTELTAAAATSTLTTTTMSTTTDANTLRLTQLKFKFDVRYADIVAGFGSESDAQKLICSTVRLDLKLSEDEFLDCSISNGSIVTFNIYLNEESTNDTVTKFVTLVQTNAFSVTSSGGAKLNTIPDSSEVNGDEYSVEVEPNNGVKEDDDSTVLVAVLVPVVIVVLVIIVVVVVLLVLKKNKNKKVCCCCRQVCLFGCYNNSSVL